MASTFESRDGRGRACSVTVTRAEPGEGWSIRQVPELDGVEYPAPERFVRSTRDRIRAALINCGRGSQVPPVAVVIHGGTVSSAFDLGIALAITAPHLIGDQPLVGELGLDGRVRPVVRTIEDLATPVAHLELLDQL